MIMNRRLFINASGRWVMLSGLLILTGFLGWRNKIALPSTCPDNRYCLDCKSARDCMLTKHQRFLAYEKEKRN
jgi:hypothetical protein